MASNRELDDAVVAACQSVARQLRGVVGTGSRVTVQAWLSCECIQDTTCSVVNIGSVMVCQAGHGRRRVIDVIE